MIGHQTNQPSKKADPHERRQLLTFGTNKAGGGSPAVWKLICQKIAPDEIIN